jgi:hypothetical protein
MMRAHPAAQARCSPACSRGTVSGMPTRLCAAGVRLAGIAMREPAGMADLGHERSLSRPRRLVWFALDSCRSLAPPEPTALCHLLPFWPTGAYPYPPSPTIANGAQ